MRVIRLGRAVLCLVIVTSAACSRKPASIRISPRKIVLYGIERSQRLTAQLLDAKGNVVGSSSAFAVDKQSQESRIGRAQLR